MCKQTPLAHESGTSFAGTPDALRMEICVNSWTPVDTSLRLKHDVDLFGTFRILARRCKKVCPIRSKSDCIRHLYSEFNLFFTCSRSSCLHVQLACENKMLEELPVAQHRNAVTAPRLVPLLEPEQ